MLLATRSLLHAGILNKRIVSEELLLSGVCFVAVRISGLRGERGGGGARARMMGSDAPSYSRSSRNRLPLVGIYKDTKNKSRKRASQKKKESEGLASAGGGTAVSVGCGAVEIVKDGLRSPGVVSVANGIVSIDTSLVAGDSISIDTVTKKLEELLTSEQNSATGGPHTHRVCPQATAALKELVDVYWSWRLEEAPEFATMCSVHNHDHRLSSVSIEAMERRVAKCRELLDRLQTINIRRLDKDDRLNWKLLKIDLETYIEGFPWRFHSTFNAVNFMENIPLDFGTFLIDAMRFDTVVDYERYLSRLRAISTQVAEEIVLMREAIVQKTTLHAVSVDATVLHLDELVKNSAEESPFYAPFNNDRLDCVRGVSVEEKDRIAAEGKAVIEGCIFPALTSLKQFLRTDYLPNTRSTYGVAGLKNGAEFYAACLKWHLTTTMTASMVHEIGLQEVARIQQQMKAIMRELGFEGKLSQFMQVLKNDTRFYHDNLDDLLAEFKQIYRDVITPKLLDLFLTVPNVPLEITPLPHAGPGSQYIPPSVDRSRPGQFQVGVDLSFPRFSMMSLTLHECSPGHHMQVSHAMTQRLPEFRKGRDYRRIFGAPLIFPVFTAYDEGWALYAEYLGEEMGVYRDSFELFGRYSEEMIRAVRLVVDTGLHMYNWSRDEAIDYMVENTCLSYADIETEVNRYLTWPGQACAYKIGELKIKELRRMAEERLGTERFNVKEFHDVVLRLGAVPLQVLEQEVNEWIEELVRPAVSSDDEDE